MNLETRIFWIKDMTDDELDLAIDKARSEVLYIAAVLREFPDDFQHRVKWQFAQKWFLSLVDESAERWKLWRKNQRAMIRQ